MASERRIGADGGQGIYGAGMCADGLSPYVPGVNCVGCGRFVGRDGQIAVEHLEMSNEVAGIDGMCRRCVENRREPAHA